MTRHYFPLLPRAHINSSSRQTFQDDCARHRFIVWAAVKRNSCSRMRQEEKLRCPLLRCNQDFPDHEQMLRHLAGCEYLASGEYLCYEHMRVERFDDIKCKRCLGHPSKRRKVISVAKSFFQSLGHRSKRSEDRPGHHHGHSAVTRWIMCATRSASYPEINPHLGRAWICRRGSEAINLQQPCRGGVVEPVFRQSTSSTPEPLYMHLICPPHHFSRPTRSTEGCRCPPTLCDTLDC